MRYIHKWHTPVVVKVNGVDEHWYNAPGYDPKRVPALRSAYRYSIERMKYQREIGFTFQAVFIAPRNLKMK